MNACKDCRFHDESYGNSCRHASIMLPHVVHGWVLESCEKARAENGKCGPDAKLFVPSRMSKFSDLFCKVS